MDDLSTQARTTRQLTFWVGIGKIPAMGKPYTPTSYRKDFCLRVRSARALSEKTPLEVATALGIPKDTYHRYETRTLLPHHMLQQFCDITAQDLVWLITGKRSRPVIVADVLAAKKTA